MNGFACYVAGEFQSGFFRHRFVEHQDEEFHLRALFCKTDQSCSLTSTRKGHNLYQLNSGEDNENNFIKKLNKTSSKIYIYYIGVFEFVIYDSCLLMSQLHPIWSRWTLI